MERKLHATGAGIGDGVRRVPSDAPAEPFEVGIVASGHVVDVPTDERALAGYDIEGHCEIYRQVQRRHQPGEPVKLPRSEIARLRALGFLVDPDAAPVQVDKGRRAAN